LARSTVERGRSSLSSCGKKKSGNIQNCHFVWTVQKICTENPLTERCHRVRFVFCSEIGDDKKKGGIIVMKKIFVVEEHETIDECLKRIKAEGYRPIRRMERPIFREVQKNGETVIEPCGRIIEFEAVLNK
jgi:hypothetical protein